MELCLSSRRRSRSLKTLSKVSTTYTLWWAKLWSKMDMMKRFRSTLSRNTTTSCSKFCIFKMLIIQWTRCQTGWRCWSKRPKLASPKYVWFLPSHSSNCWARLTGVEAQSCISRDSLLMAMSRTSRTTKSSINKNFIIISYSNCNCSRILMKEIWGSKMGKPIAKKLFKIYGLSLIKKLRLTLLSTCSDNLMFTCQKYSQVLLLKIWIAKWRKQDRKGEQKMQSRSSPCSGNSLQINIHLTSHLKQKSMVRSTSLFTTWLISLKTPTQLSVFHVGHGYHKAIGISTGF
jgi:hypothetical protein